MRPLALSCLLLTGCCWFGEDAALPAPATDNGLSGAESNLDHLTDKRDSRVAAAITEAQARNTDHIVGQELDVARLMLPSPNAADLAFAKDRAEKGDDAFYAKQVEVSRQLASAIIEANKKYESEKARKQAEYDAALKEKELALAAEQEARQSDKWTYAGIGLVTLGLLVAFLSPMKLAGLGIALTGFVVGAFPFLVKQAWFLPSIGGLLGMAVIGALVYVYLKKLKVTKPAAENANKPDEPQTPPQG